MFPGADLRTSLHSSLNVISSAAHGHADMPLDGNAESVIAKSPFASYTGPAFGRAEPDGIAGYRSDSSDEGECGSSRSGSMQVRSECNG